MLSDNELRNLKREYADSIGQWVLDHLYNAYSFRVTCADGQDRDEKSSWDYRDISFYIGNRGSLASPITRVCVQLTIEEQIHTGDRRVLWADLTLFQDHGGDVFIYKTMYGEVLDGFVATLEDKMGRSIF